MKNLMPLLETISEIFSDAKIEWLPSEESIEVIPKYGFLYPEEVNKLAELAKANNLVLQFEGSIVMYSPEPDEPK